ncbi:HXXEE domain-containing protein [Liquorilactobacillus satsumensis]|nr:HXXEE domain-containing protein [Liquorilactobacillus satsumensis]MCC7666242.1 HXXEE domain-containing protein [Liquorilactobacillus satsumensis]MCP9313679.1 HXXEE domain-containing protein [Liquorilactobacillus satsumensis]MCP9358083.1 HXXEE domain-containing protein [Liquorilactobacillus satsumensis]MCP9360835.1 HXXEE domain-containing protein [Liquorilactobacillus satsumensis]MCP9372014.1 HXXEE domain-containing protein [Liquorilactobacillus satsumensis]
MLIWSSYWLLPLLFMFHDFEELTLVPSWLEKHSPNIHGRMLFGGIKRADILALGIWEEFCIYLLLSATAAWFNYPLLIVAATIPYLAHLMLHLVFSIVKRGYVPGVATALLELLPTIAYLTALIKLTHSPAWQWVLIILIVAVLFVVNLGWIHWGMAVMGQRLAHK